MVRLGLVLSSFCSFWCGSMIRVVCLSVLVWVGWCFLGCSSSFLKVLCCLIMFRIVFLLLGNSLLILISLLCMK